MIFTKNNIEARAAMLSEFQNKTGSVPPVGSVIRSIIDSLALQLDDIYGSLRELSSNAFLSGASGEYLDAIGELFGMPRYEAVKYPSVGGITIYTIDRKPLASRITPDIFNNMKLKSIYGDEFTVTSVITQDQLISSSLSLTARVDYAVTKTLAHDTVTIYSPEVIGVAVTNTAEINTYTDRESDDDYRYRLMHMFDYAKKANSAAVRLAALAVPGVADVKIIEGVRGTGSFDLYVIGENLTTDYALVDVVSSVLKDVVALGTNYTVKTPQKLEVYVDATVYAKNATNDELTLSAISSLKNYIDNIPLGGTLNVPMIEQAVANSNNKIVSVQNISVYIAIVDEYGIIHKSKLYKQSFTSNDVEKFMLAEVNPVQLTVINT